MTDTFGMEVFSPWILVQSMCALFQGRGFAPIFGKEKPDYVWNGSIFSAGIGI